MLCGVWRVVWCVECYGCAMCVSGVALWYTISQSSQASEHNMFPFGIVREPLKMTFRNSPKKLRRLSCVAFGGYHLLLVNADGMVYQCFITLLQPHEITLHTAHHASYISYSISHLTLPHIMCTIHLTTLNHMLYYCVNLTCCEL